MRKPGTIIVLLCVLVLALAEPVMAQQRRLSFIRDAEIEHTIRTFAGPIFAAAGINGDSVSIALVKDNSLNAFVAGGMNLFLHTGLLMETQTPDQLIGVIAHEVGHIAGGHLVRSRDAMEGAAATAILSTLLGIGAAIATGEAGAGAAVMSGGQEMARRGYLAFSRTQESAADQAALSYLDQAGLSAEGMLAFLERLGDQELLPENQQVEFVRTHPLTRDRIEAVRFHVERSPFSDATVPPEYEEMHRRMHAKLLGFIQPQIALRRFRDDDSVSGRYGLAIALFQRGELARAVPLVEALIEEEPDNPFFHELKGQMLFENGRIAEAVPPYRRAVALLPKSALLQTALAHALLESGDDTQLDTAIEHLQTSVGLERRSPFTWRLLATAWGRKGNEGMIAYALAEEALARGDRGIAKAQAERAENLLPAGSPGWLRAQDIRVAAETRS